MTEVADRVVKAGGPALLFTDPKGYSTPVLMNQFGSDERMCLALGADSYDELAARVAELTAIEVPDTTWDKLKALGRLKAIADLQPRVVKRGACQEVVLTGDQIDLEALPVLKCWPLDGGRYITLPLVFTKHPRTGARNVGMYRLQVFDKQTTGMHWHIHKDAAEHYRASQGRMEVAVAIGTDPALTYAATAPLPPAIDELLFAGFLRGEAVDLVQCRTVDLQVPAHAEFVLEGYVDVTETRIEGPFGDHTGYYSLADEYPVLHLTAITHRRDPIYSTTIVGQAPMEDAYLGKATERLFLPLMKLTLPELVDWDLPKEGGFHNCVIVAIDKRYPLQARKVMHALWGMGQMQFAKCIVVVDRDVDVHDYAQVAWRVFNNVDWKRDTAGDGGSAGRARPLVAQRALGRQDRHRRHQEGSRRGAHPRMARRRADERRGEGSRRRAVVEPGLWTARPAGRPARRDADRARGGRGRRRAAFLSFDASPAW